MSKDPTNLRSLPDMTKMHQQDKKGRCIHHPHIKLRKKNIFGKGWKVLKSSCPDCCVDELRRLYRVKEDRKMDIKIEESRRNREQRKAAHASRRDGADDGRPVLTAERTLWIPVKMRQNLGWTSPRL